MSETLIVQTNSGPVRGALRRGTKDTQFYTFKGIPYGKAPVGELRFKAPQKVEPWTEVRDAIETAPICPQGSMFEMPGEPPVQSEDCLYVNVYKKLLPNVADRKLPVMVMIHGGGFVVGSSNETLGGPDFLLEHDILYITVNYRLNVFGFLSIPDRRYDIPGNAGLKDQSMALRWVAENCAHFGGDPYNITIMGISAGGASVHYHLISDHSKNLFHRAIVQSGSALNSWANRPQDDDLNERLARALGWNGEGGNDALWKTIIAADAADIVKHSPTIINDNEHQNGLLFTYVPTVEPYDNGTRFVDRDLRDMNRKAWSHSIPIIVGGTNDEGYMLYLDYVKRTAMFDDNAYFDNALPRELGLPLNSELRQKLGAKLRAFYYGDEKPTVQNFKPYVDLLTEKQFWHGIYAIVKARVANPASAPTYLYNFNYSSEVLLMLQTMMFGGHIEGGTTHGEDMLYQFRIPFMNDQLPADSKEVRLRETYNSLCTTFAATGKPTSQATAALKWEPVRGPAPFKCLNLSPEPSIVELPNTKRLQFWDSLCDY